MNTASFHYTQAAMESIVFEYARYTRRCTQIAMPRFSLALDDILQNNDFFRQGFFLKITVS